MPDRFAQIDDHGRRYVRELTATLASLDLKQVKDFYGRWAAAMDLAPMPEDDQLEQEMYLMILELPGLSHLHQTAQRWLLTRGHVLPLQTSGERSGCGSPPPSPSCRGEIPSEITGEVG